MIDKVLKALANNGKSANAVIHCFIHNYDKLDWDMYDSAGIRLYAWRDKKCFEIDHRVPNYVESVDESLKIFQKLLPDCMIENLCEWRHETVRARGPWMCDIVSRNDDNFFTREAVKCSHAPSPSVALLTAIFTVLKQRSEERNETAI